MKRNQAQYKLQLKILSYKELYGFVSHDSRSVSTHSCRSWTMDEIVKEIGLKNNCTFCGVFRRQALDRGATLLKADKIATGSHIRHLKSSHRPIP